MTLIALWELVGGLLGFVQTLRLYDLVDEAIVSKIFFGTALAICGLSLLAGTLLIRQQRDGRILSLGLQALQVVQFSFGWCRFELMIGPRFQIGYATVGRFWAVIAINPSVELRLGGWTEPFAAVNLLALAAFMYLVGLGDQ